jgi:hypothetical protein
MNSAFARLENDLLFEITSLQDDFRFDTGGVNKLEEQRSHALLSEV